MLTTLVTLAAPASYCEPGLNVLIVIHVVTVGQFDYMYVLQFSSLFGHCKSVTGAAV